MSLSPSRRQTETLAAALVAVAVGIVGLSSGTEQLLGPKFVVLERVARLKRPAYLSQPPGPGSQLYVVEKTGRVRILNNDRLQQRPFLDIKRRVKSSGKGDEQGMLSLAFPPDYPDSGHFYVAYTDRRDALRVVEFRRSAEDPLVADRGSARTVLRITQPTPKHHGGLLLFGPDGYLYIGSGDGGPSGDPEDVAQDKRELRGKILRIDPRQGERPPPRRTGKGRRIQPKPHPYTVPKDNPFVKRPGRGGIWWGATCSATTALAGCSPSAPGPGGAPESSEASASRCRSSPPSARTTRGGSTCSPRRASPGGVSPPPVLSTASTHGARRSRTSDPPRNTSPDGARPPMSLPARRGH